MLPCGFSSNGIRNARTCRLLGPQPTATYDILIFYPLSSALISLCHTPEFAPGSPSLRIPTPPPCSSGLQMSTVLGTSVSSPVDQSSSLHSITVWFPRPIAASDLGVFSDIWIVPSLLARHTWLSGGVRWFSTSKPIPLCSVPDHTN